MPFRRYREDALEQVGAIAAVDEVDVLWIGQYDLTASLGIPGQLDHPDLLRANRQVIEACERHGKTAMLGALDIATLAAAPASGFRMVTYMADLWIYQQALKRCFGTIRESLANAGPADVNS
jgi:2-dehydro-3-deoxyglucarate aldolase/4-hydroxy-2-oxoheptanedioate aldolase